MFNQNSPGAQETVELHKWINSSPVVWTVRCQKQSFYNVVTSDTLVAYTFGYKRKIQKLSSFQEKTKTQSWD